MQTLIGNALSILMLPCLGFVQGGSPSFGSLRGDAFTKGANGKPAVLPGARIVLHGPITKAESDTQGAFAIDGLPPRTHEIKVNAPGLNEALTVRVSAATPFTVPDDLSVAAVTRTRSTQLTRLKGIDFAFSRKVQHA